MSGPDTSWQRLKDLFGEAIEIAPAERAEFLDRVERDEPALARELRSLIVAHDAEGGRLEAMVGRARVEALAPPPAPVSWSGHRLGPYRILEAIGEGGMGEVFLAERADGQFERRVAVKRLRPAVQALSWMRFEAERRVLASLDHPNVARLLDAGVSDDGFPYLVMELVEGVTLDRFCDDHALSALERVRLFRKVCAAVAHAHRNLVVHRDLKPSNVLVTAEGEPKLLDFGIAKLLVEDGSDLTRTRQFLATPGFASPEQVSGGAITTASDVYALGVLLYRLIAGRHPYRLDELDPFAAARVIVSAEPDPPSGARRATDLDAIVLKALRKEPEARYPSVDRFSEDLAAWLDGRPVEARAGSTSYRAGKFLRRHRAGVAFAVLLALSLIAGIVATATQARRALRAKDLADRRFTDLRRLAHAVIFEYHDAIGELPGSTPVRAKMVRDALTYLDGLARDAAGDTELVRELAQAYAKIGDVQGNSYAANLGDSKGALASYAKSLELLTGVASRRPGDLDVTVELARGYERQADVLWDTSALERALASYRRAESLLDAARRDHPADLNVAARLAQVLSKLGDLHGNPEWPNLGDLRAGIELQRRGLVLRREVADGRPNDASALFSLVISQQALAALLVESGDLDEAHTLARDALANAENVVRLEPSGAVADRRMLGNSQLVLGDIAYKHGRDDEALAAYRRLLDNQRALLDGDRTNQQLRRDVMVAHHHLARSLLRMGRVAEALHDARGADALASEMRSSASDNRTVRGDAAMAKSLLGEVLAASGDREGAYAALTDAVELRAALAAEDTADRQAERELLLARERLAALR